MKEPKSEAANQDGSPALASAHGSAADPAGQNAPITASDAQLLRDILAQWDALSNLHPEDSGYEFMTDHCHDLLDRGRGLADKLDRISKPPNSDYTA